MKEVTDTKADTKVDTKVDNCTVSLVYGSRSVNEGCMVSVTSREVPSLRN